MCGEEHALADLYEEIEDARKALGATDDESLLDAARRVANARPSEELKLAALWGALVVQGMFSPRWHDASAYGAFGGLPTHSAGMFAVEANEVVESFKESLKNV